MFNNNTEYHTMHCKVNCKEHKQQTTFFTNITQGLKYITYDSTDLYRYYYKVTKFLKLYIYSNARISPKSIQITIYLI